MLKITDKRFRYTPSFNTDLRKRFRRMEQERRALEALEAANAAEAQAKVVQVTRKKAG